MEDNCSVHLLERDSNTCNFCGKEIDTDQEIVYLKRNDIHVLHDAVFDIFGLDINNDLEFIKIWKRLPKDLRIEILLYGANDTPTREKIHEHLEEHVEFQIEE